MERGLGVLDVLLADGVNGRQAAQPLGARPGGREVGLGHRQRRLGLVDRGAVGRRIDLVEQLPGAHIRALLEAALLEQAADLRPDLRDQVGRGAAGQFGGQHHALRSERHGAHLRRAGRRPGGRLAAAGHEHRAEGREADREVPEGRLRTVHVALQSSVTSATIPLPDRLPRRAAGPFGRGSR